MAPKGGKNSRFFHKYASNRKEHNKLERLKDASGIWKETKSEVHEVITDYFSDLFCAGEISEGLTAKGTVRIVSMEQNNNLIEPVTDDEVKRAIFAMYPEKSPGIDRFNPAFFQAYWIS